ncbi:MAG: hypothetical protein A3C06_02870 [Candidatus Taylorbacteria bacterium RIFCSPHIGHO2_02_FULL_46_13]|uniref:AlgX/AlgJ SGNH hydrolase-like domain-containing protein n=1 Tax=Candidatus Taylorbacteria bacterium RIFCSPHIGHO2_02_FULL_46_13 TaxID=1802312 RepID=A0A1G2MRK6_9BACT|nr:MAG: hypothetical protein A3C06_02870 [Candidatus Taylorbacteria bacterium RIFCSPHIGHO2_02_FULL_46_13]
MAFVRFILSLLASLVGIVFMIPMAALLFPFWYISVLVKISEKLKPKIVVWEDIIQFDQRLGWRVKPKVDAHMEVDNVYHLTTGEEGWRGNFNLKESTVVAVGDSFVFGQGVDDKDYFANLTHSAHVKPLGAPGYGATHYLLLLQSLTTELKGKLVIWFVYTGNDFRESIRPSSYGNKSPYVFYNRKRGQWEIQTDHINPQRLPFNFEKSYNVSIPELADLFSKNHLSEYAYAAFEYLAKEAQKHCDTHGAKFVIITTPVRWFLDGNYTFKIKRHASKPDDFSVKYPDEQAAIICKRNGIVCKSCFDEFSLDDFLPRDLHWSRKGNQTAANIIDALYRSFVRGELN